MSKLSDSLANAGSPGVGRLRGATGGMNYRAATVNPAPQRSSLSKTFDDFGKTASNLIGIWDKNKQDKADERSNEIIRKLTPEQRREAINNGTLLYQDDPYAMEALRTKTGRNAAYLVDDDVMQKVRNGDFRTRQEMEEYRHSRLQEGAVSWAEQYGINPDDEQYQKGFNSDITERNISLYGAHDTFLSEQAKAGNIMNSRVELNGVLSDDTILVQPDTPKFFSDYISSGLVTGSIPTDAQAQQIISGSLRDVAQRPGGATFLMGLKDQKVKLNGVESTYGELMGEEQWNALEVTAQSSLFDNNAKLSENMSLKVSTALEQGNPMVGWEMLQGIKEELDRVQPGEQMTPQRQALINAQQQMMGKMSQYSAAQAKELDKKQKTWNKNQVIDEQFRKRLSGDYVSTAFKDMPTNENTGEFTHSDMVNYANTKLSMIDQMDIPQGAKDKLKLDYLRADSEGGAFRTAVGTLVSDAAGEWQSQVINGEPGDTPAMDKLREMRNVDPNLFAALYGDQAELFLTMDMMDKQGVKPQVLIDADRAMKTQTKDMRFEDDKAWASLKNNSKSPEIKYMPAQMDTMARKIYDSVKYRGGNPDMAMEQVDKFLKESTYTFSSDDVDGGTYGVIPKNALQVNDDPKSWEQGRDIIIKARDAIIQQNPWITNQQLTVYESGGSIYIMDTTGENRVRYDKEVLSKTWADVNAKQQEAAKEKALKDAQKRAPISRATEARKEAGKRVRENKKDIPKFIYGRKE